jgi:RNA polymerase sigma factor for flagellar operon FliA
MDAGEQELWRRYRADPSIDNRNALIEYYWPLAVRIAEKLLTKMPKWRQVVTDDLVNDAIPALMGCIESYEGSRQASFATYAHQRLRGAMIDGIRNMDWVPRLERVRQKHNPDHPVVAVESLREPKRDPHSPDYRPHFLEAKETSSQFDDDSFWAYALRCLNKREKLAVLLYYREGLTMKAVGKSLGVSESRISQQIADAMERIRDNGSIELLLEKS